MGSCSISMETVFSTEGSHHFLIPQWKLLNPQNEISINSPQHTPKFTLNFNHTHPHIQRTNDDIFEHISNRIIKYYKSMWAGAPPKKHTLMTHLTYKSPAYTTQRYFGQGTSCICRRTSAKSFKKSAKLWHGALDVQLPSIFPPKMSDGLIFIVMVNTGCLLFDAIFIYW